MSVERILESAIESIKTGWTQEKMARNSDGHEVDPTDDSACRWCLIGALLKSTQNADGSVSMDLGSEYRDVTDTLKALIGEDRLSLWNDAEGRTQEDVLALLNAASILQEARGRSSGG